MHRHILLLTIVLAISLQTFAGKKLKVLFIGNSYTYVNNLPQVTADIAASMGDTLLFDSYTIGGYSFSEDFFDPHCAEKIASAKWDYVVLQEQSIAPAESNRNFMSDSYSWGRELDHMIAANDSCSKVMFYMTWGYKNGFASSCTDTAWPYPCTYEGMDSLINLRYKAYADSAVLARMGYSAAIFPGFQPIRPALISPVGAVRHYIRDHYPAIELYQSDDSHPTEAGTYAGACTFYTALFHKDPMLISYNYVLNSTDAGNIKNAAKLVTYDSMSQWHMGTDLRAQFTFSTDTGNAVSFTNTSTAATNYIWNFGDGGTSVTPNPNHIYLSGGIYSVKLVAISSSCSDTTFEVINTWPAKVENIMSTSGDFIISPNPAKDILNIHALKPIHSLCRLAIVNTLGQEIYYKENMSADEQINISSFRSGLYLVTIKIDNNTTYRCKVLKL